MGSNDNKPDDKELKSLAKFLFSTIKLKDAVQVNKRVQCFKGNKLVQVLTAPGPKGTPPRCATPEEAMALGSALLKNNFMHRSVIVDKKKRLLKPVNSQDFVEDSFYTWIFQGSMFKRNLMSGMMIAAIILMCLFPVWPNWTKVGVWYISVTLLLIMLAIIFVRLIVFLLLWGFFVDVWILPNFFDEDLSVADSFRPLISIEKETDYVGTAFFRMGVLIGAVATVYFVATQPTDFDVLMEQQSQFIEELYSGKFISDMAEARANMHVNKAPDNLVPNVDDLERQIAEDAACEATNTCEAETGEAEGSEGVDGSESVEGSDADEPEEAEAEWEAPDADDDDEPTDDDDDDEDEDEKDLAAELD